MKSLLSLLIFIVASLLMSSIAQAANPSKVLMVVSGYGQDQGKTLPGYEFDEFAKAYLVFEANGVEVDIASPNGGSVVADAYDPEKPYNQKVLSNKVAMKKLENTMATADVNAKDYAAVFVVGGKGAMFDLPKDKALQKVIANIYEAKGTVSAVCHGPAVLARTRLSDGSYLVAGKRVNGFTNEEEALFGKKWKDKYEFLLETELKKRGGKFQSSPMMLNHVAVDERLVTGQNPFSTVATAQAVVQSIGLKPVAQKPYKEDATIALISDLLEYDEAATAEIVNNHENYQPQLVAMYGYYYLQNADVREEKMQAIYLMELAMPHMDNPRLQLAIAQGYLEIGEKRLAKENLEAVLKKDPEMAAAKELLASLK